MAEIKIHVFHTGMVCVAPELPFGGEHCNPIKASGIFGKKSDRLWLPVSAYLIECSHGKILFDCGWNGTDGPVQKSYDVFGDGSLVMINIPGHCKGLCALKITNEDGKYVLLFSDGGYAKKSWDKQITSGIADDKEQQKKSLEWIREQSLNPDCVESLANHDSDIEPHIIKI